MLPAIILAAGDGRRVFPYDVTRQKAALPVGNRPLICRTVEHLRAAGCGEIVVVVGHRHERVRHALRDFEGLAFVEQSARDGTAPATLMALERLTEGRPFLVVYGDTLIAPQELTEFVARVEQEKPFGAAMVAPLGDRPSLEWLCAQIAEDRLTEVRGHPRAGSHRLCGCYAFSPQAVKFIAGNAGVVDSVGVGGMPPMEAELAQSVSDMIEARHEVFAHENRGLFCDIDKPWHLLEANQLWARHVCDQLEEDDIHPTARIHDGAEISGHVALGEGSEIGNRVVIKGNLVVGAHTSVTNGAIVGGPTILGDRVKVRDYCAVGGGCVVGDESIIAHGAEFWGLLFPGVYLYHYCELCGIFGEHVDIGAATVCGTLRFDDREAAHEVCGRRETPDCNANETYMGDYSRTGVNAILMPGVKIGSYCCVGPGVIAYEDLPHNTLVVAKQELIHKPWGPEKYGW